MIRSEELDCMLLRGVPVEVEVSSGSVFGGECLSTSDVLYASHLLIKER